MAAPALGLYHPTPWAACDPSGEERRRGGGGREKDGWCRTHRVVAVPYPSLKWWKSREDKATRGIVAGGGGVSRGRSGRYRW